jgi:hypothetical protein
MLAPPTNGPMDDRLLPEVWGAHLVLALRQGKGGD